MNLNFITLSDGQPGLRREIACEVRAPADAAGEPVLDYIASTPALDHYNEVIDQAGWDFSIFERNPVIVNSHNYSDVLHILGRAPLVEVREGRLHDRVQFALDNPVGKIAYDMARKGFIPTQSVGFRPTKIEHGKNPDEPARIYRAQKLLEISLVVIPANPEASQLALAVKSGAVEKSDLRELLELLKKLCKEADTARDTSALARGIDGAHLHAWLREAQDIAKRC